MTEISFLPISQEAKLFPPIPSKFKLPEWYKKMPIINDRYNTIDNFYKENEASSPFTVKKCMPVFDYLTSGYLMSYISDVYIDPLKTEDNINNFIWKTPSSHTNVITGEHNYGQCPVSINGSKYHYIKLGLPWRIKTPPGYSSFIYQPYYQFQNKLNLFPAIVDTDSLDVSFNIPGYINSKEPFNIKAGDPLVVIFPFKREKWKMKIEDKIYDNETSTFVKYLKINFFEIYKNYFHSKKRYD